MSTLSYNGTIASKRKYETAFVDTHVSFEANKVLCQHSTNDIDDFFNNDTHTILTRDDLPLVPLLSVSDDLPLLPTDLLFVPSSLSTDKETFESNNSFLDFRDDAMDKNDIESVIQHRVFNGVNQYLVQLHLYVNPIWIDEDRCNSQVIADYKQQLQIEAKEKEILKRLNIEYQKNHTKCIAFQYQIQFQQTTLMALLLQSSLKYHMSLSVWLDIITYCKSIICINMSAVEAATVSLRLLIENQKTNMITFDSLPFEARAYTHEGCHVSVSKSESKIDCASKVTMVSNLTASLGLNLKLKDMVEDIVTCISKLDGVDADLKTIEQYKHIDTLFESICKP